MGACRFLHWLPPDDGTGKIQKSTAWDKAADIYQSIIVSRWQCGSVPGIHKRWSNPGYLSVDCRVVLYEFMNAATHSWLQCKLATLRVQVRAPRDVTCRTVITACKQTAVVFLPDGTFSKYHLGWTCTQTSWAAHTVAGWICIVWPALF